MDESDLLKIILVGIALVIILPLVLMALIMPTMTMWGGGGHMWDGSHMWQDGSNWGTGASPIYMLGTWLLVIGVLVVIGYLLYRAITKSKMVTDPAIEEVRLAYARGELSEEEFEERMEKLGHQINH